MKLAILLLFLCAITIIVAVKLEIKHEKVYFKPTIDTLKFDTLHSEIKKVDTID